MINWDFIRKFGGEKGGRGEGFLESKRGRGAVFWGGEEVGKCGERRVLGYGGVFREVREVIGLVFVCRKRGKSGERGRWLGCGGDFKKVKRKRGGVLGKRAEGGSVERGGKSGEREVVGLCW